MKIFGFVLMTFLLATFSTGSIAGAIEVPLKVYRNHTYDITSANTIPDSGDYYFVYSGHRCFPMPLTDTYEKNETIIKSQIDGTRLYCYSTGW